MKKVYVCSPYRGNTKENERKAEEYCRELVLKGFLPIAPHIYFTRFLDDNDKMERELAISINKSLISQCDELMVFGNTISEGMKQEVEYAKQISKTITYCK